jgi:hypothetical protein
MTIYKHDNSDSDYISGKAYREFGDEGNLEVVRGEFLDVLQKASEPLTANEIWRQLDPTGHMTSHTVHAVRYSLTDDGLIMKVGRRQCYYTGKTAGVYKLNPNPPKTAEEIAAWQAGLNKTKRAKQRAEKVMTVSTSWRTLNSALEEIGEENTEELRDELTNALMGGR